MNEKNPKQASSVHVWICLPLLMSEGGRERERREKVFDRFWSWWRWCLGAKKNFFSFSFSFFNIYIERERVCGVWKVRKASRPFSLFFSRRRPERGLRGGNEGGRRGGLWEEVGPRNSALSAYTLGRFDRHIPNKNASSPSFSFYYPYHMLTLRARA